MLSATYIIIFCLTAAECTGEETPEAGPTILVDFKIVMFSASGLKVVYYQSYIIYHILQIASGLHVVHSIHHDDRSERSHVAGAMYYSGHM